MELLDKFVEFLEELRGPEEGEFYFHIAKDKIKIDGEIPKDKLEDFFDKLRRLK